MASVLRSSMLKLGLCVVCLLSTSTAFSPSMLLRRPSLSTSASCSSSSRYFQPLVQMSSSSGLSQGESQTEASYQVPENSRKLRVRKPLGIILEEVHDGKGAYVFSVTEGSNAEKAGLKEGELLVACSAATLKAGKEGKYAETGYGGRPFDNWEIVMFPCIDTPFKSIMQALASNNERWGIDSISVVLAPKAEVQPAEKQEIDKAE